MAHSKRRSFAPRYRSGLLWDFKEASSSTGALRSRFVYSNSSTTVEVFPSTRFEPYWLVVVDDIEVLELNGPDAESRAFGVADAFALQEDSLVTVLKEQGYVKTAHPRRRKRRC